VARPRRFDEHAEILPRLLLTDEFRQTLRAQSRFRRIFLAAFGGHELGTTAHPSDPRLYLLGKSSAIGTTAGDFPFGTMTRARGS